MDTAGFFDLMNKQHLDGDRKRRLAVEAQWKQFGEIREKDLLLRIGYSSQGFFEELLSSHPAKELSDSVKNVDMAFDILSRSRAAFVDISGKFHTRVVHQLHKEQDREPALSEATKEVYTYSCAAESLVQAYRHMISGRAKIEQKYHALRTEIFSDSKILQFIKGLRKSNNHVHILTASPHFTITNRFEGKPEVKSGISFNRTAILNSNEWSPAAKSFVEARDNLEVIELIDEHFKLVSHFKDIVLFRTGIHSDKG